MKSRYIAPMAFVTLLSAGVCTTAFAQVTDRGLTDNLMPLGWADTANNGDHRDHRQSDSYPYVTPPSFERIWKARSTEGFLRGNVTVYPLAETPNGNMCGTMTTRVGQSALACWERTTGNLVWETLPWLGVNDTIHPDGGNAGTQAFVDDKGNIYFGDGDQYWSYTEDGQLRWVFNWLEVSIDTFGLGNNVESDSLGWGLFPLPPDAAYVVGVSSFGDVYVLDSATGQPAARPHRITQGEAPNCPRQFGFLPGNGMADPSISLKILCNGVGATQQPNHPGMTNDGSRFFVTMAGDTPESGRLVAIEVKRPNGRLRNRPREVWEAPLAGFSGTTPTVNLDNTVVVVADSFGTIYGFDTEDGTELWTQSGGGESVFSPGMQNNIVYSGNRLELTAFDVFTGDQIIARAYPELAFLERRGPAIPLLFPTGEPEAQVASFPAAMGNDVAWIHILVGYPSVLEIPGFGTIFVPKRDVTFPVNKFNGERIPGGTLHQEAGVVEGTNGYTQDGFMSVHHFDNQSSIVATLLNPILPGIFNIDIYRSELPEGGYSMWEASSYVEWMEDSLIQLRRWFRDIKEALDAGEDQRAFDMARSAALQLTLVPGQLNGAVNRRNELTQREANRLANLLDDASALADQARDDILAGDDPTAEIDEADNLVQRSQRRLLNNQTF